MERYVVILCVLHERRRSVLLQAGMGGTDPRWQLPEFHPAMEAYNTNLAVANEALQEQFGVAEVTTRYAVRLPQSDAALNVYVTEPLKKFPATDGAGTRWFPIEGLAELAFATADQGELLLAWLRGVGEESQNLLPWWREGWVDQEEVRWQHILDDPKNRNWEGFRQVRSSYTSSVLRAAVGKEAVYLKSVAPPFLGEITLTQKSAVVTAVYALFQRRYTFREQPIEPRALSLVAFGIGLPLVAFLRPVPPSVLLRPEIVWLFTGLALITTVLPTLAFAFASRRLPPVTTATVALLLPVFATSYAAVVLKEIPSWLLVPGGALVLCGLGLILRRTTSRQ